MEKKKFKLGLFPKLIIAIIIGILFGQFLPVWFCRIVVTLSSIFSTFLSFIIPLMILAYVTMGIANLKSGAGKLLLITVILAYLSTLAAGSASFLVADTLFPSFMSDGALEQIAATAGNSLESYFSLEIPPLFDTLSAVVLAFVLGLCLSTLRGKTIGDTLYNGMSDFSGVIDQVLHSVIIPLLPLYICGTFTNIAILGILWKVFLVVILMHLICIFLQFLVAGAVSRKNPFRLIRNQIPGYITALGTQSCGDPQLCGPPVRQHPHGRLHDHHHRLLHRCVPDEPDPHQPGHGDPLHYDPGHRHGGLPRRPRRLHHDRPALPVHGLRGGGRRPQRPHLRHHGGPVYHPGLLRHRLQRVRGQRHRRHRGDHLSEIHQQGACPGCAGPVTERRSAYGLYQCL